MRDSINSITTTTTTVSQTPGMLAYARDVATTGGIASVATVFGPVLGESLAAAGISSVAVANATGVLAVGTIAALGAGTMMHGADQVNAGLDPLARSSSPGPSSQFEGGDSAHVEPRTKNS